MKKTKIFSAMAGLLLTMTALTSCEGEKDLIIIEGNLPIKTNALYMLGDATPNGWDNGNPTPFTASEDDNLIFNWEGNLYAGEIKLCLVPGSWDVPFIRPAEDQREISSNNITNETFIMHAGDPDEKWRVTEAGQYRLTFNLRDWTMSTFFLGGAAGPEIEPIETETMYLVGDATPAGWNIDAPTELTKTAAYTFEYEGVLKTGEFKGYTVTGNWNAPAIRPTSANVKINKDGVESEDFVYVGAPDDKWVVEEAGTYRLTFDLENWKIKAEYLGEAPDEPETDPLLDATVVYFIGDATPGGWGWDNAIEFTPGIRAHEFTWTGQLATGHMKGSVVKDGSYSCPFIRPSVHEVEINADGVAANDFVFTTDPDDQWLVTLAGVYTITLNLEAQTINVRYKGDEGENPGPDPIDTDELFMLGSATPNGWDNNKQTPFVKTGDYTFVFEGHLTTGEMKACMQQGSWDVPFIRPAINLNDDNFREIDAEDIVDEPFQMHPGDPDQKWMFNIEGDYRITFDLEHWTYSVEHLDYQ